ncbi:HTH-type transcriptional regulator XynR [Streptomyces sp. enrichment culture]|uniref:IclR family transcriptional regulator n=1 Tax=Streptomyces sp. enrichment culture TaxID=1795815 RepID=UPI003F575B9F
MTDETTKPAGDSKGNASLRALERALDVLETFNDSKTSLRLTDIAKRTDLHLATAQRILTVLERRGYVSRTDRDYRMGLAPLLAAHTYLTTSRLTLIATPVLQELMIATGLTASLFVRIDHARVAVQRIEGPTPLRYQLPIGQRLPLHKGIGKLLLADLDDDQVEKLVTASLAAAPPAEREDVDLPALLAQLPELRERGWIVAANERVAGTAAVAAPVTDNTDGRYLAIVSVTGLSKDIDDARAEALVVEVRRAADAISTRLS